MDPKATLVQLDFQETLAPQEKPGSMVSTEKLETREMMASLATLAHQEPQGNLDRLAHLGRRDLLELLVKKGIKDRREPRGHQELRVL